VQIDRSLAKMTFISPGPRIQSTAAENAGIVRIVTSRPVASTRSVEATALELTPSKGSM
jgi:hypothetical protein